MRPALRIGAGLAGASTGMTLVLFHLYAVVLMLGLAVAAVWLRTVSDRMLSGCFMVGWMVSLGWAIWGQRSGGYLITATWQGYLLLLGSLVLLVLTMARFARRGPTSRTIDPPNT